MKGISFHRFDIAVHAEPWELKKTWCANSSTSGAWELNYLMKSSSSVDVSSNIEKIDKHQSPHTLEKLERQFWQISRRKKCGSLGGAWAVDMRSASPGAINPASQPCSLQPQSREKYAKCHYCFFICKICSRMCRELQMW